MTDSGTAREKSELEILLERNAYGGGLTLEQEATAFKLIQAAPLSDKDCWVCSGIYDRPDRIDKAIYDTGLCKGHAAYALATGK
jgi:hypothetical protein